MPWPGWLLAGSIAIPGISSTSARWSASGGTADRLGRPFDYQWSAGAVAEELIGRRRDTVLVEMGVPALRPAGTRAYVVTHGAARVSAEAAAEVLLQRSARPPR